MFIAALIVLIAIAILRAAVLIWAAYERRLFRAQGFPSNIRELNQIAAPPLDVVNRTKSLTEVLDSLMELVDDEEEPSPKDRALLDSLQEALRRAARGDATEFERIARSMNMPVRRGWDLLRADIPLNQIPIATNIAKPLEECFASAAELIERLLKVLREGACQCTIDFTPWPEVDLTLHLSLLRNACRLLQKRAIVEADLQRPDEAVNCIEGCFLLARVLENEPTVMSQIVRGGLIMRSIEAIEHVWSRCAFTACHLDRLRSAMPAHDRHDATILAAAGDMCLVTSGGGLHTDRTEWRIARIAGETPKWWSWRLVYELPLIVIGFEELRDLCYLVLTRVYIGAIRKPDSEMPAALSRYYQLVPFIPSIISPSKPGVFLFGTMQNKDPIQIRTQLTALHLALAIETFRIDKGQLPNDLSELMPGYLPQSPVALADGQPFWYEKRTRGYELRCSSTPVAPTSDSEQSLVATSGVRVLR